MQQYMLCYVMSCHVIETKEPSSGLIAAKELKRTDLSLEYMSKDIVEAIRSGGR